ncbi:1604_t:CDS:2 [Diversispora eburnea]|uniref:1604_t:CDS:1 n=1 Tax=Diversispora eburnea TaxID=1213867 RepID=A0A9N8YPN7_9GLOM|nr:1604_t:CDS:2 [Diversispora eburnea]
MNNMTTDNPWNFLAMAEEKVQATVFNNTRGRKKSKSKTENDDDDSPEEKRRKFLERNPSKCRQKKKAAMEDLKSKADSLEAENNTLKTRVNEHREELLSLKDLLLRHENCSCNIIQEYIVKYYQQ